jgi:hypothetical protein
MNTTENKAEQTRGEWGATWYQSPYGDDREFPYVFHGNTQGRTMRWRMDSMEQAVAVANALNRLAALERRGEG